MECIKPSKLHNIHDDRQTTNCGAKSFSLDFMCLWSSQTLKYQVMRILSDIVTLEPTKKPSKPLYANCFVLLCKRTKYFRYRVIPNTERGATDADILLNEIRCLAFALRIMLSYDEEKAFSSRICVRDSGIQWNVEDGQSERSSNIHAASTSCFTQQSKLQQFL